MRLPMCQTLVAIRWVALCCLALGCNGLLGIEEHDVVQQSPVGTGDAAPCTGDACPAACSATEPCPGDQRCVEGKCEPRVESGTGGAGGSSGVGGGSGSGSGGTDAPIDSGLDGAAGSAGSAGSDATVAGTDAPAPVCEGDVLRCEGAAQIQRSQCVAGQWTAIAACENGELCDSTTGECEPVVSGCSGREPGAAFCSGRERVVCGPDLVTAQRETCPTIEHCTGSVDGKCLPCVANEHKCEGNQLQVCNADRNGFDLVTTCDAAPCNADLRMCTTLVCTPDTYTCNTATNTLRLCNADGTAFLQETPCNAGICDAIQGQCDKCAPNEFSCMSATEVLTCDRDGQVQTMQTCTQLSSASTPLCNDVKDACVACIAPSSSCVDRTREQNCTEDGTWAAPEACVDQTCYQGRCTGSCGPNVPPRCATGGGSEACGDDGEWHTVDPVGRCPVCIGNGVCVACTTGQTRCDSLTHQSTCVANAWDASTPCSGKTCVGNACTGDCAQGQQECRSDGRYTCNNQGMFVRAEPCSMCQMEGTTARCVACQIGDYICMTADLYKCKTDQTGFEFVNRCASPALCDAANDRCVNQDCNPLEVKCVGGDVQTCNATGSAHTTLPCNPPTDICDPTGNAGAGQCDRCTPVQTACFSNTQRSVCSSDGQTFTTPTCGSGTPACLDNACVQCNPAVTPTMCDSLTAVRTCQPNGSWGAASTCVNKTCTDAADNCTGSCAQGQARCTGAGSTIRETCTPDGAYGNGDVCPGVGGVCTGAVGSGVCRECSSGVTRCDGTSKQFTCASNVWGTSFNCSNQTCLGDTAGLGGTCRGSCSPSQKLCVSGQRAFTPCGGDGEWNMTATLCGGSTSDTMWQVCRDQAGPRTAVCVNADPLDFGFTRAAIEATSDSPLFNWQWLLQPITVTERVKIQTLTASIKSVVATGQAIQMVIYSQRIDTGSGTAQPDRRLALSALRSGGAVVGPNTMNAVATVDPGTYWVGVMITNGDQGTPATFEVARAHAYVVGTAPYLRYRPSNVLSDPPDPYPSATLLSGRQVGVWATGKPLL